jgi:hypothetical protein
MTHRPSSGPRAKEEFFVKVVLTLQRRIQLFSSFPLEKLSRLRAGGVDEGIGARWHGAA